MNISIVGGGGFLGRHLYSALKKASSHTLVVLDKERPDEIEASDFRYLDVTDSATISGQFEGFDVVFYKAGLMGPAASFENASGYYDVNLRGLLHVLLECQKARVPQIVFDSTESVFGPGDRSPFLENQKPTPASVYGVTKLMAEHYLRRAAFNDPIDVGILRYPRIVSRHNQTVFSVIADKVRHEKEILISANGSKRFDAVHLEDVVAWNLWFVDNRSTGIFHLSAGFEVSVVELATVFHRRLFGQNKTPKITIKSDRTVNDNLLPDSLLLNTAQSTEVSGLPFRYQQLEDFVALFL